MSAYVSSFIAAQSDYYIKWHGNYGLHRQVLVKFPGVGWTA